ncbi:MAG: 3-phosphoshikimate 1-carboxyvinyltransferase [Bacilli bacterium]
MKVKIYPTTVNGSIEVPGSKSILHRYLIASALADGTSTIIGSSNSEDIRATMSIIEGMGAKISQFGNMTYVSGIENFNKEITATLDAHDSASTLRFLLPILSLFKNTKNKSIYGSKRLLERPIGDFEEMLGIKKDKIKVSVSKNLIPGIYHLSGDISSQYGSGLMMALPLLDGDSKIIMDSEPVSKPYIDLTISILHVFGINIEREKYKEFTIKGNQKYIPTTVYNKSDYSTASIFICLAAMNSFLEIRKLSKISRQADAAIFGILDKLGVKYGWNDNSLYIYSAKQINSITVDLKDDPDLAPVLMALCAKYHTLVTFINYERLMYKESSRINVMMEELSKLGVQFYEKNGVIGEMGTPEIDCDEVLDSHNDHRVCFALSILGTVSKKGLIIDNAECINKSYPNFFNKLGMLNVKVEKI